MNKGECSKCGKTVIASTINDGVCLACRQPEEKSKTLQKNNASNATNHNAAPIATLHATATVVLMVGILSGLIIAVLGGQSGMGGGYLVIVGILVAIGGLVQWAFIRVFAGIALDIKAIREKI